MKILFIHNRYQYKGGEDTNLEMEINVLEEHGHQTRSLLFSNDHLQGTFARIKTGVGAFYNTTSVKELKNAVADFKPDVIHVHNLFFNASPSILYAAKKLHIPVIITLHNYRFICANALLLRNNQVCELCIQKKFPIEGIRYKCYRSSSIESGLVTAITGVHKILRTLQRKTDTIVVPSEFLKKKLVDSSLQLLPGMVTVKPNFVNDILPALNEREDFFLFVGRISTEKGIQLLLHYLRNNPGTKLVLAGDGPEKENLVAAIGEMPSVTYKGQLTGEGVLDLMKRCRALIFPSIWYEGLPLTIIESLACGTPVIASRLGAMPEMIQDRINGLTFTPNDATDLARAINDFNASDYEAMQRNARASYETKYNKEVHYRSILNIYQEAINKRSKNE